jgi:hypothetical protein
MSTRHTSALNYARDTASTVYATGQVEGKAFRGGKNGRGECRYELLVFYNVYWGR